MIASSRRICTGAVVVAFGVVAGMSAFADQAAVRMRAAVVGAQPPISLTVELLRWSTDAERAPLLAALSPPPPAPITPAVAAGRGARGGRGGARGGRGAAPPATPADRLMAAVKAAPTVGFIWGDGPTGYSIKYAWHSASSDGHDRIVVVTDRRLGANATSWPRTSDATAVSDFTVIELRVDGKGAGEGKVSSSTNVRVDADASTLALGTDVTTPVLLKVAR